MVSPKTLYDGVANKKLLTPPGGAHNHMISASSKFCKFFLLQMSCGTNLSFSTGSLVFSIAFFAFSTIIDSFRSPAVFGRDIVARKERVIWQKGNVVKNQIILALYVRAFQSKSMPLIFGLMKRAERALQRISIL